MTTRAIIVVLILLTLIAAVLAQTIAAPDRIKPYSGMIGADSPFYGLKLFVQQLDESLAGNANAKLQKQMDHAGERLSETEAAASTNNTAAMKSAIDGYNAKINEINATMELSDIDEERYSDVGPEVGDYQQALQDMITNNSSSMSTDIMDDLADAYNNSTKVKTGRPFVVYNNTTYFVPPGHLKNGKNMTFVPPGLAKKGYQGPPLEIVNNTTIWGAPFNQTNLTGDNSRGNSKGKDKDKDKDNASASNNAKGNSGKG